MVYPHEVSKERRLAQVVAAVFFGLTAAGVIFGYAALKPVLISQGVYSDLCTEEEKEADVWVCKEQDLRLNFMFTLSTVTTNSIALPVGIMLDKVGPRWTSLLGAVFFALGNFIFGLGIETTHIDTYYAGYILLALGGPLIFLSNFHLSNAFPARAGVVLSLVTGAFDCSSIPYLIYAWCNDQWGPISIRSFFWGYLIIPALAIVYQLTIAPHSSYEREDHRKSVSTSRESTEDEEINDELPHIQDPVIGIMFGKPVGQQLRSSWFILIMLFLCVYMCRINWEIQTITGQLVYYLPEPETAYQLSRVFALLLPLGGVVGIFPIGLLLDHGGVLATSLTVLVSGVAYGLLGMTSMYWSQFLSITILVLLRPLMYTFVGDYCARIFGFVTFGTVYGLANSASGLFSLILRPLDVLMKGPLEGNPDPVNWLGFGTGLAISTALSWRIWSGSRGRIQLE